MFDTVLDQSAESPADADIAHRQSTAEDDSIVKKNVICGTCDGFCPVQANVKDGRVVKVAPRNHPILKDVLCLKGAFAPKAFANDDRILYPLKRVGARGEGKWERVSWDDAMDDIAQRLQKVIDQYGPEAFAVAHSGGWLLGDNGTTRRFMNHIGSPNFIANVAYCAGNTAAVNRFVIGWHPRPDILNSKCIVLIGHDPRRHSWTMEYKAIRMAQAKGAKLIVQDPRKSENAERADIWLPLRAGTDAAMQLGWVNYIIEQELYDKDFVRDWTVGFEQLAERAREYPLDLVSSITGVDADLIAKAARMYATSGGSCIPWTPITDQQVNSTSAIRLQSMLRAITGNLDVKGSDTFVGFNPAVRSDSEIEAHEVLPETQKKKQLGAEHTPVYTYRGMRPLEDATERVWGVRYANLVGGCYMANPMRVFKAMAEGDPYPIKALFSLSNNTLMAFTNTRRIYEAMMNQDLIVTYEHTMSPTAAISDYVLPGDSWLERPTMQAGVSEQGMEPPGECINIVTFWHELAKRMNLGDKFPWKNAVDILNYRLEPGNVTWNDVVKAGRVPNLHRGQAGDTPERQYLKTGFATPSGKVELYSATLAEFGFDPLPYYREAAQPNEKYPLALFVGWPEDEFYRTGHRNIPELRKRNPDPSFYVHPEQATLLELTEGEWARIMTSTGSIYGRVFTRSGMPIGLVRVGHGWWKPEVNGGKDLMSGMWDFCDAVITSDDDADLVDTEQGVPHLKGMRCALEKLSPIEVERLENRYGKTVDMPRAIEKPVVHKNDTRDFMYDDLGTNDVEFDAIQLSIGGRGSKL
ncbi:molybdopterin-dependent oxidoreductase [Cupriavidus sp. 2SB]|uniref:molybdopterin-containing oxidoreductase family protein n=1 Tax=Cupriavidus sp. 2SB TaxID=2502199 RepID=UPI0010F91B3A|nr:molybdopterin-dependent oxidoreductase [Cupriavidus sp. 2SB]